MKATEVRTQLNEALKAAGVEELDGVGVKLDECQLYRTIREFMHNLDRRTGKLDPKRYGIKAVAGMMKELLKLRGCGDA